MHRDLTDDQLEEEKLLVSLMRIGWGRENPAFRQVFATQLRPEATREEMRAFDELMRISTTPENAARLESEMHQTDIRFGSEWFGRNLHSTEQDFLDGFLELALRNFSERKASSQNIVPVACGHLMRSNSLAQ